MQGRRTQADRIQSTRTALLAAARALFLEKGYAGTGTPEVVERAGLTRGALYHHFRDKRALFQAVVEAEAVRVATEIEAGSTRAATPLDALLDGAAAFFAAMRAPGRARLLLLEGPAVLGPETMRRIDLDTGGQELRRGLEAALGPAVCPTRVATLADLVSAMFDRAALAGLADPEGCGALEHEAAMRALLAAIVIAGAAPGPSDGQSRRLSCPDERSR